MIKFPRSFTTYHSADILKLAAPGRNQTEKQAAAGSKCQVACLTAAETETVQGDQAAAAWCVAVLCVRQCLMRHRYTVHAAVSVHAMRAAPAAAVTGSWW
jgi:hypothetical protein